MAAPLPEVVDLDGPVSVAPVWSLPLLLAGEPLVEAEGTEVHITGPEPLPGETPASRLSDRLEDPLAEVVRPTPLRITLARNGRSVGAEVLLLPPWSYVPGHRPWSLLSLILPGEDEVTRFAARVEERAEPGTGAEGLVRSLFETLVEESLRLEPPRVQPVPLPWQEIGPPWRVLGPTRPRRATCLDLTLLAAGVLEALGEAPLVLLEGDDTGHAWLGVAEGGPGWTPWSRETPSHSMLAVELTAACAGEADRSWAGARRKGAARLETDLPLEILDVRAGRPPQGRIRPLQVTADAVTHHALAAARRAGDDRHALHRESLHILLGLLEARGPVLVELLGEEATDRVRGRVEAVLPDEGSPVPPAPTANWSLCVETARILARNRGSRVVQEGDLLRAVLQNPSRNIEAALRDGDLDPGALRLRLEVVWPRVREETRVRRPRPDA
jgi:hypothetical protein